MTESRFRAQRKTRAYCQTIEASPEAVFPLLCPVREAEWLDGWRYSMIYSGAGGVEDGAVFSTRATGEEDTLWVVSRYDTALRLVEFTRFTPGSRTCLLRIAVTPHGERHSHVDVSYTYTSIAPAGDAFIQAWTEERFLEAMRFWERSMNHFLRTGQRLPEAG